MVIVLAFLAAVAAAWAHWTFIGWSVIAGWLTIWVAAYIAVFVTAVMLAMSSKRAGPILAATGLAAYFLAGHVLWTKGMGLEARAVEHLGFAAVFAVGFRSRAAGMIALAFVAMVIADAATAFGVLASAAQRPRAFLALSHPDVLALLGHGTSIILGLWSGGDRIAEHLDRPWRPAGARRWSGAVSFGRWR